MQRGVEYSGWERFWLGAIAVLGFVVINGVFLYGAIIRPDALQAALSNPIAAAFIGEALVLAVLLGYLLQKWGVSERSWGWFVVLSLVGSIAFALPVVLLWRSGERRSSETPREATADS